MGDRFGVFVEQVLRRRTDHNNENRSGASVRSDQRYTGEQCRMGTRFFVRYKWREGADQRGVTFVVSVM